MHRLLSPMLLFLLRQRRKQKQMAIFILYFVPLFPFLPFNTGRGMYVPTYLGNEMRPGRLRLSFWQHRKKRGVKKTRVTILVKSDRAQGEEKKNGYKERRRRKRKKKLRDSKKWRKNASRPFSNCISLGIPLLLVTYFYETPIYMLKKGTSCHPK